MNFLAGSRTYILGGIGLLAGIAHVLGFIDLVTLNTILGVIVPSGLITLRASK